MSDDPGYPPGYPGGSPPGSPPGYPPGYPGSNQGGFNLPPPPQRPGPPPSVRSAVKAMYVGAALSGLSVLLAAAGRSAIRRAVLQRFPNYSDAQLRTAVNVGVSFAVLVGLIGVALWLWMAYANGKGEVWARVLSTVFFGIDTLALLFNFLAASRTPLRTAGSVVVWAVGLVAIVLLWRPESSAYFNAPK